MREMEKGRKRYEPKVKIVLGLVNYARLIWLVGSAFIEKLKVTKA